MYMPVFMLLMALPLGVMVGNTLMLVLKYPDLLTTGFVAELYTLHGQNLPARITGFAVDASFVLYILIALIIKIKKGAHFSKTFTVNPHINRPEHANHKQKKVLS